MSNTAATSATLAPTIYVSGPMSGLPDNNFPAFNTAAKTLRMLGYSVVNPAEFTTDVTGLDQRAAWQKFMKADIKALVDCDAIVMLPSWPDSPGATMERDVAQKLGLQVFSFFEAVLHIAELQQGVEPAPSTDADETWNDAIVRGKLQAAGAEVTA